LRIVAADISREEALALARRNAVDSWFMPANGRCYCGSDLVQQYGLLSIASGYLPTGCRACHRSFVD
jgi:hypothetical protein